MTHTTTATTAGIPSPRAAISAAGLDQELPVATTFSTVRAPRDLGGPASGRAVHPTVPVPVHRAPRGTPIAVLPARQPIRNPTDAAVPTWLPVIAADADDQSWVRVLLPCRPNGATGWVHTDARITEAARTARIEINHAHRRLRLFQRDTLLGAWPVAVGKPCSPTPRGRTFLLAQVRDLHPAFSPLVFPLGLHATADLTYGGLPGTLAIHTWPIPDVFGHPCTDGGVRIPASALDLIAEHAPAGTCVLIH